MDNREAAGAVEMRMRVGVGHAAVGCPARVTKSDRVRPADRDRVADSSGSFGDVDVAVRADRDAPGVISAILELAKRIENHGAARSGDSNVAKNPAHVLFPFPRTGATCLDSGAWQRLIQGNSCAPRRRDVLLKLYGGKLFYEAMHTGYVLSRRSLDVFEATVTTVQPGEHPPNGSLALHRVNLPPPRQVQALIETISRTSRLESVCLTTGSL